MNYIVVDTETTGLPANVRAPPTNVDNWPRLVSIAWITPEFQKYHLIKPSVPITNSDIHGITTEMAEKDGRDLREVLAEFLADCKSASLFVAHSASFDYSVINCELFRCGMPFIELPTYCTMEMGTEVAKIRLPPKPGFPPKYKWPKLGELADHFGIKNELTHNALSDALVCRDCYLRMQVLK